MGKLNLIGPLQEFAGTVVPAHNHKARLVSNWLVYNEAGDLQAMLVFSGQNLIETQTHSKTPGNIVVQHYLHGNRYGDPIDRSPMGPGFVSMLAVANKEKSGPEPRSI